MEQVDELQGSLLELLRDLEMIADGCAVTQDEMGMYLLDLALEECREAIWRVERTQAGQQLQ